MGTVWLVRRPGGARCFVMKLPHKDALAKANELERHAILSSFEEESRVLTSLYHPNVASIIDSGIYENLPFLVLEYLIGADMRNYVRAKLLTLPELKPIVTEACAGLASLHERGWSIAILSLPIFGCDCPCLKTPRSIQLCIETPQRRRFSRPLSSISGLCAHSTSRPAGVSSPAPRATSRPNKCLIRSTRWARGHVFDGGDGVSRDDRTIVFRRRHRRSPKISRARRSRAF